MHFSLVIGCAILALVAVTFAQETEDIYHVELQHMPSVAAQQHVPGEHDFVKVDIEVVQLLNPQGLLADGKQCDGSGECDSKITVFLDTDRPLTAWPGGKAIAEYDPFFSISNSKSPVINKNVSTNVCGGSINKVNLRAHVVDADLLGSGSVIEDFECIFSADYRQVARAASSAEWSPTLDCKPRLQQNQVKLQFRFRIYDISPAECGIQSATNVRAP